MVMIGVDYGRKRMGFAIFLHDMVLPLDPSVGPRKKAFERLEQIKEQFGDLTIVLGLPFTALGKETELTGEVRAFADQLEELGYNVNLVDETGTTIAASNLMRNKDRKGHVDSMAACMILKRYLNIL